MSNIKQTLITECNTAQERYNSVVEILRDQRLPSDDVEALKDMLDVIYNYKVDLILILDQL